MGRRPNKKNHKQETSSEEEEEESGGANFDYGSVPRGPHHQPPNPFGGISFC